MPYVQAKDGTRLYVKDWGSGPPVVLIHGWPLNADMWEYNAPVLASNGLRVVAYDRRGFGRSDQPWSGYDYDTFADDLEAVMEALDLRGAALVGFSMGGGEVARYLSRHGAGRVSKAALLGAVTPYLLKDASNPDGADQSVFDGMLDGLATDRQSFLAGFGKQFFGAGMFNFAISSEMLQWSWGLAMQASPKATTDCVRAFGGTDFRPDMAAFTMPTLIVHGTGDAIVPIDPTARTAARMIPGARLIEYEDAPHALFYTDRDRLNGDLLAFIRG